MIQCDAVHKRFPDGTTAVHDLSLHMPEGCVTVLVGSSGCGRTTTLRMINRMVDPTSGTIEVGGKDVTRQDAAELRRSIGYVIQQSGLLTWRTRRRSSTGSRRTRPRAPRRHFAPLSARSPPPSREPDCGQGGYPQCGGRSRCLAWSA